VGTPAFVAAKIATPNVGPASIRPDVLDQLEAGGHKRLLVVRAPAGYGKTAVVVEAARRLAWRAVWYKIDVLDHDPAVLVASLVQAIRAHVPGFGDILIERFADAHEMPMTDAEMAALLVAELEDEVPDETHLVFDDYQEAAGSPGLNRVLEYLLANLPDPIRVVLITRFRPAVAMGRLKLDGHVAELSFDDLRLDPSQVAEIVAARSGRLLDDEQAVRIAHLTEGWPASIVLISRALGWTDLGSLESALADPRLASDIFSYLSEEAFRREDAATAEFMTRTCCLDSITVELATDLADTAHAEGFLEHLVARNVFTFVERTSGTYRYHHLFRDYLRQKYTQEHGAAAFRDMQLKTAGAVERAGDSETAIELCFAANAPEAALAVVSRSGELVTDNCRLDALRSWLERLPPLAHRHDPWGLFLKGQLALREGRGDDALAVLRKAQAMFEERDDRWGLYHSLSSIEAIYFWKGDFSRASRFCRMALQSAVTTQQTVHTLVSLGSANAYRARWKAADRLWNEAEARADDDCQAEASRILALRANATFLHGSLIEAHEALEHALDRVIAFGSRSFAVNLLGTLVDVAVGLALYDAARQYADSYRSECDRYGLDYLVHMLDDSTAQLSEAAGDLPDSIERLREISRRSIVMEDTWSHVWALVHLSQSLRRAGQLGAAMEAGQEAVEVARNASPILALSAEANLLFISGLTREASGGRLTCVRERAERHGLELIALQCRFWQGVLDWQLAPDSPVSEDLRSCVVNQLHLGHIHFVTQEMATYPGVGVALLTDPSFVQRRPELIHALARGQRSGSILVRAMGLGEGIAKDVLTHGLRDERSDVSLRIMSAAKRHPSASIRRLGWSLSPARRDTFVGADGVLSPREIQVLALMAAGDRNLEIAEKLFLSEKTVKTHVNHIFTKLGVGDRVQAVLYYRETIEPARKEDTTEG
jgi:ATP/maltotriose-dependent transcriptional regulator MalT